jgi:hypothetical protein
LSNIWQKNKHVVRKDMRRAIRRNDVARDHREQDIIEKKDTIGETKWYGHSKKDIKDGMR